MKNSKLLKYLFLIPLLMFIDYVLMILIGCTTCLFGFGHDFYNGNYGFIGEIVLGLTAVIFLFFIFKDIKESLKKLNNATS